MWLFAGKLAQNILFESAHSTGYGPSSPCPGLHPGSLPGLLQPEHRNIEQRYIKAFVYNIENSRLSTRMRALHTGNTILMSFHLQRM